jgi:hypothetical protein
VAKIVGAGFRHKYFRYAARAGCHPVRREDVKRLKDLERENATRKRFLADAELDPPRSGCDVAVLAAPLRQGPSATGFRPAYRNARAEGWAINHEKMQCLWRVEGLRVPQRRRHKGHGSSTAPPTVIADAPNRVAVDFQFDVTTDEWPIKIVSIVEEHTGESLGGMVERSITGEHLIAELSRPATERETFPAVLRRDKGLELGCRAMAGH